jgi:hypothetical protein
LKVTAPHTSGKRSVVNTPRWSPSGSHLLYRRVSVPKPVELPADFDVFLAAADGRGAVNLTADVDTFLTPVAWR